MLNYARNYGSATEIFGGPDRMLRNFRATAGLDTKGAQPPGVPNAARPDGLTFLDVLWDEAPFTNHPQFIRAVERISAREDLRV